MFLLVLDVALLSSTSNSRKVGILDHDSNVAKR